jgi:hypothetical protein
MFVCVYSALVYVAALEGMIPHPRSPTDCARITELKWKKKRGFTEALCSKVGATGKRERVSRIRVGKRN